MADVLCAWCGRPKVNHGLDGLCEGTSSSYFTLPLSKFRYPTQKLVEHTLESDEEHIGSVEFNGRHDVYVGLLAEGRNTETDMVVRFVNGGSVIEIYAPADAMLKLADLLEDYAMKAKQSEGVV